MPLSQYLRQAVLRKNPEWVRAHCALIEEHMKLLQKNNVTEIDQDDTVNGSDRNRTTALMLAAKEGLEEITQILLSVKDIAVDAEDNSGKTALYYAASAGHLGVVEKLIEQKANPNKVSRGRNQSTALIIAAFKEHWPIVEYLLKEGKADIRVKDANGRNVFHMAICGGTIHTVRRVAALDPSLLDELTPKKSTPLMLAAHSGKVESVAYLLKEREGSVNAQNSLQVNALFFAIAFATSEKESKSEKTKTEEKEERASFKIVKLLVTHGADPDAICQCDGKYLTPLQLAAGAGQLEILNFLLDRIPLPLVGEGARRAGEGVGSATCLTANIFHHAAESKNVLIVDSLLAHFKKSSKKPEELLGSRSENSFKETPLHIAAYNGSVEICERFIKVFPKGVDEKRYDDRTALHLAAQKGFTSIVELLLKNTANPNAIDNGGRTPLHLASANGNSAAVKILLKYAANVNALDRYHAKDRSQDKTPLCYAICIAKSPETVAVLLDAKADVDTGCSQEDGRKSLHLAAAHQQPKIVELILKTKTNVNAVDDADKCALIIAINYNDLPTVQVLLAFKANPNRVYKKEPWPFTERLTALLLAAFLERDAIVSALVVAGADVNVESYGKRIDCCSSPTALDIAVSKNHLEMIDALLQPPLGSVHTKTSSKTLLRALCFALTQKKYKAAEKIIAAKTTEDFISGSISIHGIDFKPTEWITQNPNTEITPVIKAKLANKLKDDLERKEELRFTESVDRQRSKQTPKMLDDDLNATELPDIGSWQFRLSKLLTGDKDQLRKEVKAIIADGAKENLAAADDTLWVNVVSFLLESDAKLAAAQGEQKEEALALPLIKKLQAQHLYSVFVVKGQQGKSMLECAVAVKNTAVISALLEFAPCTQLHNLQGEFRFKDYKDEQQELKKLTATKEVRQTSTIKLIKPELLFKKLHADFLDLGWTIEAIPSDDEMKPQLCEMFAKITDFIKRNKMQDVLHVMYKSIETLRTKSSVSLVATILNRMLGLPELTPDKETRKVATAQETRVIKSLQDKFTVYQAFVTQHPQRKVKLFADLIFKRVPCHYPFI